LVSLLPPTAIHLDPLRAQSSVCISMHRYWSSLRYSFLRTLFFVGCRSTSSSNSRPPVPSFFCCVGVTCPARGFCHFRRRFLACFHRSIYSILGIPLPIYVCALVTSASRDPSARPFTFFSVFKWERCKVWDPPLIGFSTPSHCIPLGGQSSVCVPW